MLKHRSTQQNVDFMEEEKRRVKSSHSAQRGAAEENGNARTVTASFKGSDLAPGYASLSPQQNITLLINKPVETT